MADNIKQINDVLDMLADDTSVPRNIRKGAADAKARLMNTKEPMDVRATSAIVILDDLANDPNIPLHGRTLIWNIISQLEVLSQQKRFFRFPLSTPSPSGGGASYHSIWTIHLPFFFDPALQRTPLFLSDAAMAKHEFGQRLFELHLLGLAS